MYRVLIIDDEINAREVLFSIVNRLNSELTVKTVESVDQAADLIPSYEPDLIFLDIQMPEKLGFELYDTVDLSQTYVVFTTAFDSYAIRAIKLSAFDYILKPIGQKEVGEIIEKFIQSKKTERNLFEQHELLKSLMLNANEDEIKEKKLVINSENGKHILNFENIIRLQGDRNYTKIYTKNKTYLSAKTLKEYEDILYGKHFFRIHKSHIVSRTFVDKIKNTPSLRVIMKTGEKLELSRLRKNEFIKWLES